MKKNLSLYIILILILSIINISYEYLVIPFKNLNTRQPQSFNFKSIIGEEFLEFSKNKLKSSISFGTPFKTLELYLTMDYKLFFLGKGYCLKDSISFYDPYKSSSYNVDEKIFYSNPFNDLRNVTFGKDKCTLYDDYNLKTNISLNNTLFYYGNIADYSKNIFDKNRICGIMGFKMHQENSYYYQLKGLEYILKLNNITNSSFWSIEFFDETQKKNNGNNDGYIILGAGDINYLKKIKNVTEDNIRFSYNSYNTGSSEWNTYFEKIFYYNSKNETIKMDNSFTNIGLNFDNKYYFCTKNYFESIKNNFFNEYISKGICTIHQLKEFYLQYKYITCNKKKFIEEKNKFPILYLFSHSFNYTFELTSDDLFIEVSNDFLFLMFYDPWNPKLFLFGEKFMKKYNFIFRLDEKSIGFINIINKDEKREKEKQKEIIENKKKFEIIWIIILSVLLLGIILGIFVGKKIWDNKRKKRANELVDDDYEYESKKEEIIN